KINYGARADFFMNRNAFKFDLLTLFLYLALALMGWMTIYAVSSTSGGTDPFDLNYNHGRQFLWIGISLVAAMVIMSLDNRFLEAVSYLFYGGAIALLLLVLIFGKEVNGAKSWLIIGGFQFQPSELAKTATAMALAKYMSKLNFSLSNPKDSIIAGLIIVVPALIIILQNDTGSALVFGSFMIVFFREGQHPVIPIFLILVAVVALLSLWLEQAWIVVGIVFGLSVISFLVLFDRKKIISLLLIHLVAFAFFSTLAFSTQFLVSKLQPHQQIRLKVLFNPEIDPSGSGYNVIQSKIAIGSGGIMGKGFLDGNYTKYKFVPKQVTDFIFCTIGEELGWIGSTFVLLLFFGLILRLRFIAENSKTRYARIYGYSVISILFFHVLINVGMTVGLVPVIGIPLPFFSYGGSSLLSFTILIAILVNLFSYRSTVLGAKY
ncbi:MAG: rod shape-determining protein RodA, partial [Bacteroidota bacterium]